MGQTDRWINDEDSVFALLYYFQEPGAVSVPV